MLVNVATCVPGAAQHEVVRCRPGTVAKAVFDTVPDQRRTASLRSRCTASGTQDFAVRKQQGTS